MLVANSTVEMNECADILILIGKFVICPADYFRLRTVCKATSVLSPVFLFDIPDFCKYVANRRVPLSVNECGKLDFRPNTSISILRKNQVEVLLHNIQPKAGIHMHQRLLALKAVEPFLLFDTAIKFDRPDILAICLHFFPNSDQLRLWRRLRVSVVHGHLEIVQSLVNRGIPIRTLEADSDPLIHAAIANNRVHVLRHLISLGADITEVDSDGLTPFLLACKLQMTTAVEILLSHEPQVLTQRDNDGRSCVMLALQGLTANSNSSVLKLLISAGADFTTVVMPNGMLLIQYACAMNRLDVVELLVSRGASVNQTDVSGRSCLDVASMSYSMVSYLLSHGVKLNPAVDYLGKAAAHNELESCRLLARSGVILKEPSTLLTAVSTTKDNPECIEFLLSMGANPNKKTDSGESAIYRAVVYRNVNACAVLLKAGVDADTTFDGLTMLSFAERESFNDISQLLLDYGAKRLNSYRYISSSS